MWIDFKTNRMRKIYSIKCKKYKKFINLKISYICYKILLFSSVYNKCGSEDEKIFMEQEPIKILKIIGLVRGIEKYQCI